MDVTHLVPETLPLPELDLTGYGFGQPQSSGAMTMLPLFSSDSHDQFVPPLSGLKLSKVEGYGNVELYNPSDSGIAIVPLHIGYIQDQAQNHALCRTAFISAGQKLMFRDACCVQESQGGYLEGREQWFFILPLPLRENALALRGTEGYSKLWSDISILNNQFGYQDRGHLEQIIGGQRSYLTQYQNRFELLPRQTGALFFDREKLIGVEIAPNPDYFKELWMGLLCFCYGVEAMYQERHLSVENSAQTKFSAASLDQLKVQLQERRKEKLKDIAEMLIYTSDENFQMEEEERFLSLRLYTITGERFVGQIVKDGERLVYASVFAKGRYLRKPVT